MKEIFAIPCVGAIIEKHEGNNTYVLIQTRQKQDGFDTNGLIELPAGKIREYEHITSTVLYDAPQSPKAIFENQI